MGKKNRNSNRKSNWRPFTERSPESSKSVSLASNDPMAATEEVTTAPVPTKVIEKPVSNPNTTPHEEAAATEKDIDTSPRAKKLVEAYSKIKMKESWSLGMFSPLNPARLEAIDFIASIEAHAEPLFHAACIHVMLTIEQPYRDAWYWKDPKASGMYTTLTEALGDEGHDRLACLTELQNYLKEETAQSNTKFGSRQPAAVLSELEKQIQLLSSAAPTPLAANA